MGSEMCIRDSTGVVQVAGDGVVQAAHRRSWCFCVRGVWLAVALVRISREIERERYILRPPNVRPHAQACAHTRPRHRRGVGERPHVRGSVERTASLAVAKQGAAMAKQGGLGELSGLCKVYRPKRRPAEGAVLFRSIMWLYSASVVLGSALHLALAIFQQGIPCFGHCPKNKTNASLLQEKKTGKSEERKTGPRKKNQEKLQV